MLEGRLVNDLLARLVMIHPAPTFEAVTQRVIDFVLPGLLATRRPDR